jgi:hypothetical protein
VFSPIKLGQFQCPSPTQVFQFHCQLATVLLLLGDVHGFLLSNFHSGTLSVPAPMNVTGITRLSISSRTNEAGVGFIDGPGRWEAAGGHPQAQSTTHSSRKKLANNHATPGEPGRVQRTAA